MRATMQAQEAVRVEWPSARTAAMRFSGGGDDGACVVARRTAAFMDESWRLMETAALMREALSLRIPKRFRTFFRRPIAVNALELGKRLKMILGHEWSCKQTRF